MFDPRLYILGALALLSLVSVAYLVVAVIGHLRRAARARREASARIAFDEHVAISQEPVVPLGPPPVLESDPFGAAATAGDRTESAGAFVVQEAGLPAGLLESGGPKTAEPATLPSVPPAPAVMQASPATEEPAETDQTARIAALLASLEQQAEAEVAPAPAPVVEIASAFEPAPAPVAETAPPPTPEPGPPSAPPPAAPSAAEAPAEYRLVAPVELHFTDGSSRVGVRPGTRTHDEFQRLANALLSELKRGHADPEQ